LLAIPTLLMGATFPILVAHVNSLDKHVGRVVSELYFFNTLGAALGAYFAGFILLSSLDLHEVVVRAADINVLIAIVAWIFFRKQ
jgi:predicted membrane-bound spermidine synthase